MSGPPEFRDALLIVDPQVDFCPGGALPVSHGDAIFTPLNRVAAQFETVVASRDWHPENHMSFEARGGPWPVHCVIDSPGAQFHPKLDTSRIVHVFDTASDPDKEAYSAFSGTDLAAWLRDRGVQRLFVGGLATDYCVKESVLDALREGLEVVVLEDCIGAVDVNPGDGERALEEMAAAGATRTTSEELAHG